MRVAILAVAALLSACATAPSPEAVVAPEEMPVANLPDYRPETAAACNAVQLRVALAADGSLSVNGAPSDAAGLQAAARRKNDACQHAPAMVFFNAPPNAPAAIREKTLQDLASVIVNIGVIETSN